LADCFQKDSYGSVVDPYRHIKDSSLPQKQSVSEVISANRTVGNIESDIPNHVFKWHYSFANSGSESYSNFTAFPVHKMDPLKQLDIGSHCLHGNLLTETVG